MPDFFEPAKKGGDAGMNAARRIDFGYHGFGTLGEDGEGVLKESVIAYWFRTRQDQRLPFPREVFCLRVGVGQRRGMKYLAGTA